MERAAQADERIAVIGLGYVGLPVAVAFARHFAHVTGYDRDAGRVAELARGHDRTGEVDSDALAASTLRTTDDVEALRGATFFVVAVPTPIDEHHRPDLRPLESASRAIGGVLGRGAIVVYESTVYPGVTEDYCRPLLEQVSGLKAGVDFHVGYSPERINPGDKLHRLETIRKVVSAEDDASLERVASAYQRILGTDAQGERVLVHRAPSIKVAEAAKVIENTQRDINIALMNELALIFERLDIRTADVLDAAATKWNFLRFTPGLVGGHCIGVDPYYLTARAEQVGYHPQVILAGRRINDDMGRHVARRIVRHLSRQGVAGPHARVGVLGLTFKEDVPDARNSRVPDILDELRSFGVQVVAHDPELSADEALAHLDVEVSPLQAFTDLHAVVLAVPHRAYVGARDAAGRADARSLPTLTAMLRADGLLFDVKSVFEPSDLAPPLTYGSL